MIEGNFQAKPTSIELGLNKKNQPEARIEFEIVEGRSAGTKVKYSGLFTEKGTRYTKAALIALGWEGKDIATAPADVMKAPKTVPIEVQIVTWRNPETGKESSFCAVRNVGFVAEPLKPLDQDMLKDVNQWLNEVGDSSGASGDASGSSGPPIPF